MSTYRFILEIPANSEQEARAKLNLMLQLATFIKDFNTADLAGAFLNYLVWNQLGKFLDTAKPPITPEGKATGNTKMKA